MIEDTIARLDDLFTDAITSTDDGMLKSAMHMLIFIMSKDRYDELKLFDNGLLIRNYLLGIIGLINEPALIGEEISSVNLVLMFKGDEKFLSYFPCHT